MLLKPIADPQETIEHCIVMLASLTSHRNNNASLITTTNPYILAAKARKEYEARGLRFVHFNGLKVRGPLWDVLLDLYVQQSVGRHTSVKGSCLAARAPATTTLRSLSTLEHWGLITRTQDKTDGRRCYLWLTKKGVDCMTRYLAAIA